MVYGIYSLCGYHAIICKNIPSWRPCADFALGLATKQNVSYMYLKMYISKYRSWKSIGI